MNAFSTALINAIKNSDCDQVTKIIEAGQAMKNLNDRNHPQHDIPDWQKEEIAIAVDNSKQLEVEYKQAHQQKEAAKMEPLSYQQLQVLVKSNRPNVKACRANAKADVLVEYLKTINILPQEYVHTSKTTMKKQSAAKSPSATKKPARNPNGTTKKPIGSVAQKGTAGYPKYRDGQVAAPATPVKANKKFNQPSDEQIVKAAKSLELQQVAVQAKQSNVHEYNAMVERRAAFKNQIRNNEWY